MAEEGDILLVAVFLDKFETFFAGAGCSCGDFFVEAAADVAFVATDDEAFIVIVEFYDARAFGVSTDLYDVDTGVDRFEIVKG